MTFSVDPELGTLHQAIAHRPGRQLNQLNPGEELMEVVAVDIDATRSTLQLSGEVDPDGGRLLTSTLAEELRRGHRFIRLDLSRIAFLDWAGLRVLARAHNQCLAAGGTLVLAGLTRSVTWLLSLTQLDQVLVLAAEPPVHPARRQTPQAIP